MFFVSKYDIDKIIKDYDSKIVEYTSILNNAVDDKKMAVNQLKVFSIFLEENKDLLVAEDDKKYYNAYTKIKKLNNLLDDIIKK